MQWTAGFRFRPISDAFVPPPMMWIVGRLCETYNHRKERERE